MIINLKQKTIGFTLAEVLITLLIIGVVAALVIPAIINDTQEAEFKTSFKKHYAEINAAYTSLVQDNGGSLKGVYANIFEFSNAFKEKISYIKFCPVGTAANCIPNLDEYKYLDMTNGAHPSGCISGLIKYPGSVNNWTSIILHDGTTITILGWAINCDQSDTYKNNLCSSVNAAINIDVNGIKPPNVLGKDLYTILPYEKTIKPDGISAHMSPYTGSYNACDYVHSCSNSSSGSGCAAKVLRD